MKKITSALAALAMMGSAVVGASAAQAATYSGTADVYKGIALNCTVAVDFDTTPGKVHLSIGSPEPLCDFLTLTSNPHDYSIVGSNLTIYGVTVSTITLGGCAGNLTGTIGAGYIDFDAVLPEATGGGDCYVSGTVYQ